MTTQLEAPIRRTDAVAALDQSKAPLYSKYSGQIQAQPAYIEIDPRGESILIDADYSGEIGGGMPALVWEGKVHRFQVSPVVLGCELQSFLHSGEFETLVAAYLNANSEERDDASLDMENALRDLVNADVWEDAASWFDSSTDAYVGEEITQCHDDATRFKVGGHAINRATTSQEIEQLAQEFESELESDEVVIDIKEYLTSLRDICQENSE